MTEALKVAAISLGEDRSLAGAHGADAVAGMYCRMGRSWPPVEGVWEHGWKPSYLELDPAVIIGQYNKPEPAKRFFVSTEARQRNLEGHGFADAHAIGLPVVYLAPTTVRREPDSLLVMPPHSLSYTAHDWDGEAYASAINAIRSQFRRVSVCIHPNCLSRGYWVESFRHRGYEVINGIGAAAGRIPLEWLRDLLSEFEYVTTNAFGSHIVYAAYFGCKVSIFGPWAGPKVTEYLHAPAYTANRQACEDYLRQVAFAEIARQYPFLVCEPKQAVLAKEWADEEVGVQNRRAPKELRALLGWSGRDRWAFAIGRARERALRTARRWTPEAVKALARRCRNNPDQDWQREETRLRSCAPFTRGVSTLLGAEIEFVDAPSFLFTARELFSKQIYRFISRTDSPVIIDCGANIGLSVLYMKALYPMARIIAFEPDPHIFEVLAANVNRFALQDVELRQEAVWRENGAACFRLQGGDAGRLAVRPREPDTLEVRTTRLRDLLHGPIDFLKIDVEGAESDILEDCDGALAEVERVFVEYHSFIERPQRLHSILKVLSDAGLRVHVDAFEPSPHPLLTRRVREGMDSLDMALNIWAYRS